MVVLPPLCPFFLLGFTLTIPWLFAGKCEMIQVAKSHCTLKIEYRDSVPDSLTLRNIYERMDTLLWLKEFVQTTIH